MFLELFLDVLGSEFERQAVFFGCVSRQNAYTAAIGNNQEVVTFHGRLEGEREGGVEHVVEVLSLGDASLLKRGFINLGTASERPGVGSCSGCTVGGCAGFEGDNRLGALSSCFHELWTVFNAFNIEREAGSVFVFIQVGDQVSKIEVSLVANGDHLVKTDPAGVGGGSHCNQKRATLRNKRSLAFVWQVVVERSIHLVAVGEHADDVRSDDAHAIFMGDANDFLFESVVTDFTETGGDDAQALHTFFARFLNNLGNKLRWNGDNSSIDHVRHILDTWIAFVAHDFFGIRVDGIDSALITAVL